MWRCLNDKSGVDVTNVVETCQMLQHVDYKHNRDDILRHVARHIDYYFACVPAKRKRGCCWFCRQFFTGRIFQFCGRRYGNYLILVYMLCKFMYFLNVCGQFVLLNYFLTTDYYIYGYELVNKYSHDGDWLMSERFPRVTMCDFQVRALNAVQQHTVQCVLPINLFNEKVYIFVWFWYVFVGLLSFFNFFMWTFKIICTVDHIRYIKRHLKTAAHIPADVTDTKNCGNEFVSDYLRQDGLLIVRLVEINSNDLIAGELVMALWRHYRNNRQHIDV